MIDSKALQKQRKVNIANKSTDITTSKVVKRRQAPYVRAIVMAEDLTNLQLGHEGLDVPNPSQDALIQANRLAESQQAIPLLRLDAENQRRHVLDNFHLQNTKHKRCDDWGQTE